MIWQMRMTTRACWWRRFLQSTRLLYRYRGRCQLPLFMTCWIVWFDWRLTRIQLRHHLVVKILDYRDPLEFQGVTHLVEEVSCCRLVLERSDCRYSEQSKCRILLLPDCKGQGHLEDRASVFVLQLWYFGLIYPDKDIVHDHPLYFHLPWLDLCGMWNFLWDMSIVHQITHSLHYLLIM
jgi:hypothetical protein